MGRVIRILTDRWNYLSPRELIGLLWDALFKSETVLIYSVHLQNPGLVESNVNKRSAVVKGKLPDLERVRKRLERVPWEFQCDLYDGVKDFFVYIDAENGAIGHISWIYYSQDPNRTLRLGVKECEVMFCLTLPEYRGKGLYPGALRAIQEYLKECGHERCFICTTDDNVSSIHGIEKSGFRLAGIARFRKIFGIQISRRRDTRHLKEA